MKAEITGSGDELIVSLPVEELPGAASDQSLRLKLPGSAPDITSGVLGMIGHRDPHQRRGPRSTC